MEQAFLQALSAFRGVASERLQQSEAALSLVPDAADQVGFESVQLEGWHAFQASAGREVLRGLVSPTDEVLLAQGKDLGLLVRAVEAELPEAAWAMGLAERLVWLLGSAYTLLSSPQALPHALSVQLVRKPGLRERLHAPRWEGEPGAGRRVTFCLMRAERGGRGTGAFQLQEGRLEEVEGMWGLTLSAWPTSVEAGGSKLGAGGATHR